MARNLAPDDKEQKRSFSPSPSNGNSVLEEFNKEVEDFKSLNILKSPYADQREGDALLLSVREEAAAIISRIGSTTSNGQGEQPGDRTKLSDWYRGIYYAAPLLKLLRHLEPTTSSSLRNKEVIERLIDIKAGFPSRVKWLQIYQAALGDDIKVRSSPPQGNIQVSGKDGAGKRRRPQSRSRSRSRASKARISRSASRSKSRGDPSKADLHSDSKEDKCKYHRPSRSPRKNINGQR